MELIPEVYHSFPNIVGIIFNNWTAVKLAVEHGMAGTPMATERKLVAMVEAVSQVVSSANADWCEVSDLLADIMDTEFSTELEDNSNDEVAVHLCQLYQIFSSGDAQGLASALSPLPNQSPIHSHPPVQRPPPSSRTENAENGEEEEETEMPQEDGWTVVKRK